MRARVGGAWREVGTGAVRVAGAWRTLVEARAYISGAWVSAGTFLQELTASASPGVVEGTGSAPPLLRITVTSSPATATPSGGKAPYAYSWARLEGTATADSPTSATTTFSEAFASTEDASGSTFRCTVTDALGATATADVSVILTRTP